MQPQSVDQFLRSQPTFLRSSVEASAPVLYAAGAALDGAKRDELLGKAVRGEYVELVLDNVLAYVQTPAPNRNFVRFAEEALDALARSAVGRPWLRDHRQHDSSAVGGT